MATHHRYVAVAGTGAGSRTGKKAPEPEWAVGCPSDPPRAQEAHWDPRSGPGHLPSNAAVLWWGPGAVPMVPVGQLGSKHDLRLGLRSRAKPPRPPAPCACAGAPWLAAPIRGSPPPLALSARRARHRHGARRAGSTRRVGGLRPGGDRVRRHRGSAPRGRAPPHTQNPLFAALRSSSAAGSDCDLTAVALPWPRRPSARSTRGMERANGLERRPPCPCTDTGLCEQGNRMNESTGGRRP